jgi:hypothetical protein
MPRPRQLPCEITIGEIYHPAMSIEDQADADVYFDQLVERAMRCHGMDRTAAEELERKNLGYFAGYFDRETMARVNQLYATVHPIFGAQPSPSPAQALAAGSLIAAATSAGVAISHDEASGLVRVLLGRDR